MVRIVHMTDTHGDTANKLLAVGKFAKANSIDAIIHSGDITSEDIAKKSIATLQKLPQPDERLLSRMQSKTLTEEDKKTLQQRIELEQRAALMPYVQEYQQIEQAASQMRKENPGTELYAGLGNWDLTIAPQIIKSITFALEDIVIKGINVKGTTNTWEFPYSQIQQLVAPYLINYALGSDSKEKEVQEANKEEIERLRQGPKPDLMILHKELFDPQGKEHLGGAAKQYLSENKYVPVLCGHFHSPSIANYDGHTFYRAAPDTFYDIDMNEKTKKINWVDVYKLIKTGKDKQEKSKFEAKKETVGV